MYRSQICRHCGELPATDVCPACGLWACVPCGQRGCGRDRAAWTGNCRSCGRPYPDEQRRDVLDDGDGTVVCASCGWTFALRRLDRITNRRVAFSLAESAAVCGKCGRITRLDDLATLLVLHDRARGPGGTQVLYHLLCACGATLASESGPEVD